MNNLLLFALFLVKSTRAFITPATALHQLPFSLFCHVPHLSRGRTIMSAHDLRPTGLNRGAQHNRPYTSIEAATDPDVIGDTEIDPYVGTALGTAREAYCAAHSDLPENVAQALEFVEAETRVKLSKQYMLTGSLAASTLAMLVRMSGATNVLEIGAYTGYSTIALASTGCAVTTIDSFEDEADSEAVFHAGVEKSKLPIRLLKMKALDALKMLTGRTSEKCILCAGQSRQVYAIPTGSGKHELDMLSLSTACHFL